MIIGRTRREAPKPQRTPKRHEAIRTIRTPKPKPKKQPSLPIELLYDIITERVVDALDRLVYAEDDVIFSATWDSDLRPLFRVSRQFKAVALKVLADSLNIPLDNHGNLLGNPCLAVYNMRPDVALWYNKVSSWERAISQARMTSFGYTGAPLAQLYRTCEYGPWYFFFYARHYGTQGELRNFHAWTVAELKAKISRIKPTVLRASLLERASRALTQYEIGYRIMMLTLELQGVIDSVVVLSQAAVQDAKNTVPQIAKRLADLTRKVNIWPPSLVFTVEHALVALMKVLVILNDPGTDDRVRFLFMADQAAEVESVWHMLIQDMTTHGQRARFLDAAPLGFVPVSRPVSSQFGVQIEYLQEQCQ